MNIKNSKVGSNLLIISRKKETLYLSILIIIASCFFIINAPKDFGDVGLSTYTSVVALEKAHSEGGSVLDKFNKYPDRTFAFHTFGHPFSVFAMHFFCKITGIVPQSFILLNIIVVFGTTIIAFYLGKLLYDSLFGFLFSLLLTVNVFYNVIFQTGTIYYSFCIPLTLTSFYTFLRLHKSNNNLIKISVFEVIVSALFFALALFHVYPHALFGFIFSFFFVASLLVSKFFRKNGLIKFDKDFKLLNIRWYLVLLLLFIAVFYFCLTSFWEVYNGVPLGTVVKCSVIEELARTEHITWDVRIKRLPWIVSKTFEMIFVDIDKGNNFAQNGVHCDTAISGFPTLNLFEAILFFVGLAYCFIKRSGIHVFCLSTLIYAIYLIVFKYNVPVQRLNFYIIPILTFFTALGAREVFYGCIIQNTGIIKKKIVILVTTSLLLTIVVWNFVNIHHHRVCSGGNKIWLNGLNQIFDFFEENGDRKNLVVFGDNNISTYSVFSNLLYVKNKFVDVDYYNKKLTQKTISEFRTWMINTLSTYDNIIFVFPAASYLMNNPGQSYGNYGMKQHYENFLKANGYPLPSKVIRGSDGVPLHYIYKFNKQWLGKIFVVVNAGETTVQSNSLYKIENLYLSGPVDKIMIKTESDEWSRKISFLTEGKELYVKNTKPKDGCIEYYPDYSTLEKASLNTIEMEKFNVVKDASGLTWLESEVSNNNLKYLFNFPFTIKRAEVRTNPRIFNDISLMNSFKADYSIDNSLYIPLYSIRSNGNGRFGNNAGTIGGGDRQPYPMSGFNEYASYNVLYPESNKLFFNFRFMNAFWSNSHAHLSSYDKSTFFKFAFDPKGWLGKLPLISDGSKITISGTANSLLYLTLSEDITYPDIQGQLTSMGYDLGGDVYTTLANFQKDNKISETRQLDEKTFELIKTLYKNSLENFVSIRLHGTGATSVKRELVSNEPSMQEKDELFLTFNLKSINGDKNYIDNQSRVRFWQAGGNLFTFKKSTEFVYDGKYSIMLTGGAQPSVNYTINPIVVGSFYKHDVGFSAFIKADMPNVASVAIGISYEDGSYEQIHSDSHPGDNQWHQIKVTKKLEKKPNNLSFQILNNGSINDIMYADLAKIYIDNEDKDTASFLINNSFEEWEEIITKNETGLTGSALKTAVGENVEIGITEIYKDVVTTPRNWQIGGDPFSAEKETVEVYEGKTAVKLSGNTRSPYANVNFPIPSSSIINLNNSEFQFTSYIKTDRAGIANLQFGISYSDDTYEEIYSDFHPGDNRWREINLTKKFEKPLKGLNVNVYNRGIDKDIIYIDNISCKLNGKVQSALIPNNGFEEWDTNDKYKKYKNSFETHMFKYFILNDTPKIIREKIKLHKNAQRILLDLNIMDMKPDQMLSLDAIAHLYDPGEKFDPIWSFDELNKPVNLQRTLLDMGYTICDEKNEFDGTVEALRKFQNDVNLPKTGIIDKETLKALVSSVLSSVSPVNYIQNGDFGKWDQKDGFALPVFWKTGGGAKAFQQKTNDDNIAVAVTGAKENSGHLFQIIPKSLIGIDAEGQKYILTARFLSSKSNLARVRTLQVLENGDVIDSWSDYNSPDGNILLLKGEIAKNVKEITVFLWNQSPDQEDHVVFDDVKLFIGNFDIYKKTVRID